MNLEELPKEIIHNIFSQCSPPDIRSLRHVSRVSLAVANEYFLQEISLFFLKDDFETFVNLLRNPGIARGVRSLTLEVDVFKPNMDFDDWEYLRFQQGIKDAEAARKAAKMAAEASLSDQKVHESRAPPFRLVENTQSAGEPRSIIEIPDSDPEHRELHQIILEVTHAATEDELQGAYANYIILAQEQSSLVGNNDVFDALLAIFGACTQIDTIAIAPRAARSLLVGKQFRKAMLGPWQSEKYEAEELTIEANDQTIGRYLFTALLAVITQFTRETSIETPNITTRTLRHLDVGELPYKCFQVFKDPETRDILSGMLNSVRSLNMVVGAIGESDTFREEQYSPKLHELQNIDYEIHPRGYIIKPSLPRNLPKMAPRLQQLSIEGVFHEEARHVCLEEVIVPTYTWPNLVILHLADLDCEDEELVGLIQRHRNTLAELRLMNMTTRDAFWPSIFRAIAIGNSPVLKRVILRGLFYTMTTGMHHGFVRKGQDEDGLTRKIQQCIRDGGKEMPESPLELLEWFKRQDRMHEDDE